VLKLPLKLVLSAEATGLAKLRELGRHAVVPTFGGRTLPADLRNALQTFERVRDRLAEFGCEAEAAEVQEILDRLDQRVREITEQWAANNCLTDDERTDPTTGFTIEQWLYQSRQVRDYHRKKHLGVCTKCRKAAIDKTVSRSLCTKCLCIIRENARVRSNCESRYKGARSYGQNIPKQRATRTPKPKASNPTSTTPA
jgi:hypothetical protein